MNLLKVLPVVAAYLFFSLPTLAETSINNVKIGDVLLSAKKYDLELADESQDGPYLYRQYITSDGNDLSVTYQNGEVVYIEKDWSGERKSQKSGISKFIFGQTSLKDIRAHYATNGFAYINSAMIETDDGIVAFNCFDLTDKKPTVMALATKIISMEKVTEENIAEHMKLDVIVLAKPQYLDIIWGSEKMYDDVQKKVSPMVDR